MKTFVNGILYVYLLALATNANGDDVSSSANHEQSLYGSTMSGLEWEYVHDSGSGSPLANVLTFSQTHDYALSPDADSSRLFMQYRLWVDQQDSETYERLSAANVEKLSLVLEIPTSVVRLTIGQREVTWGENLLFPILDVVNVRDPNHPRGYYDPASKKPAPMVLADWLYDSWSAQVIWVPYPVFQPHPAKVGTHTVAAGEGYRPISDAEYGARLGLLLGGVDLKLYGFKHWDRVPAYRFTPFAGGEDGDITPDDQFEPTYGTSASYASHNWVVRGDLAIHENHPATGIGTQVVRADLTQGILGWSWTTEALQTFGTEIHMEQWEKTPSPYQEGAFVDDGHGDRFFSWLAGTANLTFDDETFEADAIYMHGIHKNDALVRATGRWNATDRWRIEAEVQTTRSESHSPKLLLDNRDSVALRTTYGL